MLKTILDTITINTSPESVEAILRGYFASCAMAIETKRREIELDSTNKGLFNMVMQLHGQKPKESNNAALLAILQDFVASCDEIAGINK